MHVNSERHLANHSEIIFCVVDFFGSIAVHDELEESSLTWSIFCPFGLG